MTRCSPLTFEAASCGPAAIQRACCPSCTAGGRPRPLPETGLRLPISRYEQEAQRIAEGATSGHAAALSGPPPASPLLRQQAEDDRKDVMLQAEASGCVAVRPSRTGRTTGMQHLVKHAHPLTGARRGAGTDPLNRAALAVATGGQPLRAAGRAFFESRFGRDLSRVRLHADARAAVAARGIGARAYTLGSHIAFAAGQYAPGTRPGIRLLAHELVHTLQQTVQRTPAPVSAVKGVRPRRKGDPVPIEIEEATPEQRKNLERTGVSLPSATAGATLHRDYVDRRIQTVGYGLLLGGYMVYVDRLEKPILVSADMVAPGGTERAWTSDAIFPSYRAAADHIPAGPPAPGRGFSASAFFRSHGGGVFPTVLTRANAPETLETMDAAVRKLETTVQQEMSVLTLWVAGGIVLRGAIAVIARARGLGGAIARRFRGNTPPSISRRKPVNGKINVGGGFEKGASEASNLQPFIEGTGGGGARSEVPNLVRGKFEQIAEFFQPGSGRLIYSNRLTGSTVNWEQAAPGAYTVMTKGGQLSLNVWVRSPEMFEAIVAAMTRAKFRNVRALGPKTGPGVVIMGMK